MPKLLDGNRVRDDIKRDLKPRVDALIALSRPPGLSVILAGDNPASAVYVRNKVQACADLGIYSQTITPSSSVTTDEMLALVHEQCARPEIDGVLVQLPLPPQADAKKVLLAVDPEKDVDGFHPYNVGALVAGLPGLRPCTPAGVIELLHRSEVKIAGKRAVVVGRSDIVGKPVALMLLHEHATVTICHSKTPDLPGVCREADILIAAIGRAGMITRDFIRPGAVVIDVGTNRVTDATQAAHLFRGLPDRLAKFQKSGSALVGDCDPTDIAEVSGAYTPVPGGVGPLTIAMLMMNTVISAERRMLPRV